MSRSNKILSSKHLSTKYYTVILVLSSIIAIMLFFLSQEKIIVPIQKTEILEINTNSKFTKNK